MSFDNSYTKFCSNGEECTRHNCTFAHHLYELRTFPCSYGNNCIHLKKGSNRVCKFQHPFENIENYCKRLSIELPKTRQYTFPISREEINQIRKIESETKVLLSKLSVREKEVVERKENTERKERVIFSYIDKKTCDCEEECDCTNIVLYNNQNKPLEESFKELKI